MKTTEIIPNPTWGKVLAVLQDKGTIRIDTPSSDTFKKLLDSINIKYTVEPDGENLSRFTILQNTNK